MSSKFVVKLDKKDLKNIKKADRNLIPIAYDSDDRKLVYYCNNATINTKDGGVIHCSKNISSKNGFFPWYNGDAVIYVSARRGAGKSTFCSNYLQVYNFVTGDRVFLISRLADDTSIKLPKEGMRIPISKLRDITLEDLSDSLLVFDDIEDAKMEKNDRLYLYNFIIDAIENSRHFNISILITSHMISNYSKTRPFLYESNAIVVFPKYSNASQIAKALSSYYSFNKKQIEKVFNSDSRWVTIHTVGVKAIISQNEIYTYSYEI